MTASTTSRRGSLELWLSVSALLLSLVATVGSFYFSQTSRVDAVRPSVAFMYTTDSGWAAENIGSGPARDLIVATIAHGDTAWRAPTQLYSLPAGARVKLWWVGDPDRIGGSYSDVDGRVYTSIVDEDLTVVKLGYFLPTWRREEIRRVWER